MPDIHVKGFRVICMGMVTFVVKGFSTVSVLYQSCNVFRTDEFTLSDLVFVCLLSLVREMDKKYDMSIFNQENMVFFFYKCKNPLQDVLLLDNNHL